jgi:hypothetical protein
MKEAEIIEVGGTLKVPKMLAHNHKKEDLEREVINCEIVSRVGDSEIIKHTCGCFSESDETITPARKINSKTSKEIIQRLSKEDLS